MRDLKLDIDIVDGYFAMDAEGAVHDSWRRIKELVEEKFTSTNKPSAEIAAATLLCEVYFNIAAECIGEDEVRRRVAAATSHVG